MGVEATVMGLCFRACFVLEGEAGSAGSPEICTTGSGLGSGVLSPASVFSAVEASALASPDLSSACLPPGCGCLPRMSPTVAAATSRAGMTMASSAGAGSLRGSGWGGFFGPRALAGLRDAEVADRGRGDGLHVGADAGTIHLLLKRLGLLLQVARALFQDGFLGVRIGLGGGQAVPDPADPLAQVEIGEKEQADEVKHQEDDSRARGAEAFAAEVLVQVAAQD